MSNTVRLFVVDDSEDDRLLYRRALSGNMDVRYEIEEAQDGDAALERIKLGAPDCVLLDYSLPGRNGIEVLKRIRAANAFVPVLMLTGQGSETVAVAAMLEGAQNYLSKAAINSEQIHRAIQIAIAHCAMEKRLHEQRSSLQIFTRALAHDLKEPVRTVKSFLTVIAQSEELSEQGRNYFDFVQNASDRMGALIDAVYAYTRLDGSVPPPKRGACDAAAAFAEAKGDISELIAERRATITADALPVVSSDAPRLRQVLQNLICNAIHHGPPAPRVHVSAEQQGDQWVLKVADNGPGVPADIRERIFEPFTRMSKGNGLGMGLAISQRIVESHGGRIWCEDNPGGGALFAFTVSKAEEEPTAAHAARALAPPPLPAETQDDLATILVVDDNDAAIELARIMLTQSAKLRCHLLSARSGEEAINMLRTANQQGTHIDLVLLDINMPRMDGFQVLKTLQEDPAFANAVVIMCSTSTYDKDMERANALGATGFVEKPPQIEKLRPILRTTAALRLEEATGFCTLRRVA